MKEIVVKIEDKFINEAFQKWCFQQGILWWDMDNNVLELLNINIKVTFFKPVCLHTTKNAHDFILPKQWPEATAAILEIIKPKEKKWTDDDMIRFAQDCDRHELATDEVFYMNMLKEFK